MPDRPNDKEPGGPLVGRQNPQQPPHKLWPAFLAQLREASPGVYDAAVQYMKPPEAPRANPVKDRAFRERVEAAAEKAGIMAKEAEVRRLLNADKTAQASALRNEILVGVRRLVGKINVELSAFSS